MRLGSENGEMVVDRSEDSPEANQKKIVKNTVLQSNVNNNEESKTEVDLDQDKPKPFELILGAGQQIKGIEIALSTLKVGE